MRVRRALLQVLWAVALLTTGAREAAAVLTIRITQGTEGAQPIAIVPFAATGSLPVDVAEVVAADLARTGRFAPIAERDLPARPAEASQVDFGDWRKLGTENLVIGRVRPEGGAYSVEFHLLDVFKGQQLAGYAIPARNDTLRRAAHKVADLIYEKLTGERGAFATRVAYVTESRGATGNRRYSLEVADSDGANPNTVLESGQPILSPAWSPNGRRLAYVSFEDGGSAVYIQDLASGRRERVAAFEGINSAPAWSPDGTRLALTLSRDGNPDVYVLDIATRQLLRLTDNPAIDTEPNWAPDGSSLVFTSDRGGKPQIYRVASGGGAARRVTFEGDYNARAVHSPDGKRVAMIHGARGSYRIGLLDLDTGAMRVLTETRLDESPSFSPNGSMVLYASGGRGGTLEAVSVDGRVRQRLSVSSGTVREPAWSPFLD
ncbi:MAG: Tol-Pal system beta propeller repeat protein TolB [Gammaproteobacteria bacterium]|nr:Tol-Pal system beta propeller repeat protein TolB [Gammaproteobacteria bacterium]